MFTLLSLQAKTLCTAGPIQPLVVHSLTCTLRQHLQPVIIRSAAFLSSTTAAADTSRSRSN
jgi:hypothetical protein